MNSYTQSIYQTVSSINLFSSTDFIVSSSLVKINSKWYLSLSGHPTKCSINMSYMAVTDTLKNELTIFNLSDMSFVANKKIDAEMGSTCGPYDVCLTQDNLVIYKTSSDFKLVVSDVGLREKFWFKNIRTSILGFNMLEVAGRQHLVIGTRSSTKNKYTFVLFNN